MADKLSKLRGIVSAMRVDKNADFFKQAGNSKMFSYATSKKHDLYSESSPYMNELIQRDAEIGGVRLPLNGFDELIKLTEEGKLWKYPIDNDQGLDKEKQVPFEDHVFLDHLLEDFPDNENIRAFMELVVSGLAKNHWMTVDRKHEIIKFYKNYFEDKREMYKEAGFDM